MLTIINLFIDNIKFFEKIIFSFLCRTGKCVQHTDEQRKTVRELLLGDIDEVPWPPAMRGEGWEITQNYYLLKSSLI